MYGIIRPEYSTHDSTNTKLLEKIAEFDKIIIAGEAKSHCVLESIKQSANITMTNQADTPHLRSDRLHERHSRL